MPTNPGYDELADALSRLGYTQDAAEYHGALCGALCVKTPDEIDPLRVLDAPKSDIEGGAEAARILQEFRGQSAEAFDSTEMMFSPLLPDDAEDLRLRVRALTAWCEGFLYGISSGRPIEMKRCTPELKEILKDFTEFTHADIDDEPDDDLEETAYAELVEYIRVGAQLVYMELKNQTAGKPASAKVLH